MKRRVLTVPIKAVTTRPDTTDARRRASCVSSSSRMAAPCGMTTGIQDNASIEVLSPLPEGAEVITGPYDLLSRKLEDGDEVTPKAE